MISIILNVFFLVIIGTLTYVVWNLSKNLRTAETWIEAFIYKILAVQEELRQVDKNGSFEADDEVGFIFQDIQQIIDTLSQLVVPDDKLE
jgi:uncharacterized protein YpmB